MTVTRQSEQSATDHAVGDVVFEGRKQPSNTPRLLRWLIVVLTLATAAVGVLNLAEIRAEHSAIDEIGGHAAPAVFEAEAARAALADADRLAVLALDQAGSGLLTGPGSQFSVDLAVAGQSLDQLSADSVAGPDAGQTLQTIEGLQTTYTALVQQANAVYDSQGSAAALANLWYASELMNSTSPGPDTLSSTAAGAAIRADASSSGGAGGGSILAELEDLRVQEQSALDARRSSAADSAWTILACAAADLVLFGALVAAQVVVRRRFRRVLNVRLLLGSALVLGFAAVAGTCLSPHWDLADAQNGVYRQVTAAYGQEINTLRTEVEPALAADVCKLDTGSSGGCASTLALSTTQYAQQMATDSAPKTEAGTNPAKVVAADTRTIAQGRLAYTATAAQADADFTWRGVLVLVFLLLAVCAIPWGLWDRLAEYRYRSR